MQVNHKEVYRGELQDTQTPIAHFTRDQVLYKDSQGFGVGSDRLTIEQQAPAVLETVSRLMKVLIKKNLLTEDEFFDIIGLDSWKRKDCSIAAESD
jgi:hypothetical protein